MCRMANKKRENVREQDITGLKYFDKLLPLFERLHEVGCGRDKAGNRQLHFDQYCTLILLFLFNPIVTSLRALQQASELKKVQRKLGCSRASLGSLSEATEVFDPELLREIIGELSEQLEPLRKVGRGHIDHVLDGGSVFPLFQTHTRLPAFTQPRSGGHSNSDVHGNYRLHAHQSLDGPQADATNLRNGLLLFHRHGR